MVHPGQDISFQAVPIDNNGINMKEETWSAFLHQLSNPLLQLLMASGSLPGDLLCLLFVRVELVLSNHPPDLPGGDLLTIFFIIESFQLPLAVVRIFPS